MQETQESSLLTNISSLPEESRVRIPRNKPEQHPGIDEAKKTLYKEIFEPNNTTKQGRMNREFLLWAVDRNINIPAELLTRESYTNVSTKDLLERIFTPEQIQELQGAIVNSYAKNLTDVNDSKSSATFGGIVYAQSPIRGKKDNRIASLVATSIALRQFHEPGIRPGFLRKNVKGSIHVLPYGTAEKIPGKERETLLMTVDDLITLINYLKSARGGFPRYILNATNRPMAEVAKKYMGAQTSELTNIDNFAYKLLASEMGNRKESLQDMVKVFLPEATLKKGEQRLIPLRERLYRVARAGEDIPLPELLKKIRIDAIIIMATRGLIPEKG